MKAESGETVRLIIQFIRDKDAKYSRYRLVAYGAKNFRPSESLSFAELAQRFESASIPPEYHPSSPKQNVDQTSILYAQDIALTPSQLKILGLGE